VKDITKGRGLLFTRKKDASQAKRIVRRMFEAPLKNTKSHQRGEKICLVERKKVPSRPGKGERHLMILRIGTLLGGGNTIIPCVERERVSALTIKRKGRNRIKV